MRLEVRREPALQLVLGDTAARGHVCHLVLVDFPNGEVFRLWVGEVEARHGGPREHGERFRQFHADLVRVQHAEDIGLYSVLRAGRVTRCRADAAVLFLDQLLVAQNFVARAGTRQRLRPGGQPALSA